MVAVSITDSSSLLPALSGAVVRFVLFFAVGFFALACLYAVAGALLLCRHRRRRRADLPSLAHADAWPGLVEAGTHRG
ncbi:hypothetical protein GCM10009817_24720 [Terrabacter lapilli]|uniref:Uncharacterized protein n=1 Tax=Terrabacter lapilli TaxID=436231 RepID=A0ABP5DLS8_9MICO